MITSVILTTHGRTGVSGTACSSPIVIVGEYGCVIVYLKVG